MECVTGWIRLMALKVITSLSVLLLVLVACRFTDELEVQPSDTPPPRATKVAPPVTKIPPTLTPTKKPLTGTPTVAPSKVPTPTPDLTSVPALSDTEVEELVFDELEPCKIARDEQFEDVSTITYEIEYPGDDIWFVQVSSEQQALSYGNWRMDARTASEITPLNVEANDVVFNGSRCALSKAASTVGP
jgi:hypothetical protein